MKDIIQVNDEKENMGGSRPFYSKQLFEAITSSYQSLKEMPKEIEKSEIVKDKNSIIDVAEESEKIGLIEELRALADFQTTKEKSQFCEEAISSINTIDHEKDKKKVSFEIVKYLQSIVKNINSYNEDKIRNEIHSINQLIQLVSQHSVEEQQEILDCMDEVRIKLSEMLFEMKKQEQKNRKK